MFTFILIGCLFFIGSLAILTVIGGSRLTKDKDHHSHKK